MNIPKIALALGAYCLLFSLSGCKTNLFTGKLSEGTIEYEITYIHPEELTMGADMMPKVMTYKFTEGLTSSGISAGMGILDSYVITDREKQSLVQTLSILGKKYKVSYGPKQIDSVLALEPKMKLIHRNETKKIAGYTCKKVTCDFEDPSMADVDVYYTNDIEVTKPNWYSTYKEIDGVMMEFYLYRYNIHMKLTAKQVIKESIEHSVFEVSPEFKPISGAEMEGYFKM